MVIKPRNGAHPGRAGQQWQLGQLRFGHDLGGQFAEEHDAEIGLVLADSALDHGLVRRPLGEVEHGLPVARQEAYLAALLDAYEELQRLVVHALLARHDARDDVVDLALQTLDFLCRRVERGEHGGLSQAAALDRLVELAAEPAVVDIQGGLVIDLVDGLALGTGDNAFLVGDPKTGLECPTNLPVGKYGRQHEAIFEDLVPGKLAPLAILDFVAGITA